MGSSVGALHDILLPAHPFSSTTSAGKAIWGRQSSIEPPDGAHQPPAKAMTSPGHPGTLPDPAGPCAPLPPSKTIPEMQRGHLERRSWSLPPSPLRCYFHRVTFAFAIPTEKIGSQDPGHSDAGVHAAVGCLLGTHCSSKRANQGGEAGVAHGRRQGGSGVGPRGLRLPHSPPFSA